MIIKKVALNKSAATKAKALHVRDLCDYIAGPEAGDKDEKIEHRATLNLLNIDHAAQVQEMADLADAGQRSPQPVQHWIISWHQGEQPTPAQADQAVRIFTKEMGLPDHQAIYALHRNTDNFHLHIAVNRVHPETEQVITVNKGFDIEIAHRVIARIEHEQGWRQELGGRYQVREDGQTIRIEKAPAIEREGEREPSTPARDFENLTGQKSAQRIAIEEGAEVMRQARSWPELHEQLAEHGIRFEKKGSGAILWVGETAVKASTAGRDCSMSALEKRLGEFPEKLDVPMVRPRTPEPVAPAALGWGMYKEQKQSHYAARTHDRRQVGERLQKEWGQMLKRQREERQQALGGNWRGRGELLNALRSTMAARQAQEKAALRERHQLERVVSRERSRAWPTFEEWLRENGSPSLAEEWRHRDRTPAYNMGDRPDPAKMRDIRSFEATARGWEVTYKRIGGRGNGPCFSDRGREIRIHDLKRDSVLAALQLSAQKWGEFKVFGSKRYKRMCVELAAEHGFRITNPELQKGIEAERDRQRLARKGISRKPESRLPERPEVRGLVETYERHFEGVRSEARNPRADVSRLDAHVAVRMRVTDHSRADVEHAIRQGAAKRRPEERRDWREYAKRAADHAFGISGEKAFQTLQPQVDRLLAVEGRSRDRDLGLERRFRRDREPDLGR